MRVKSIGRPEHRGCLTICYTVFVLQWTLHVLQCALCVLHCTLYVLTFTVYLKHPDEVELVVLYPESGVRSLSGSPCHCTSCIINVTLFHLHFWNPVANLFEILLQISTIMSGCISLHNTSPISTPRLMTQLMLLRMSLMTEMWTMELMGPWKMWRRMEWRVLRMWWKEEEEEELQQHLFSPRCCCSIMRSTSSTSSAPPCSFSPLPPTSNASQKLTCQPSWKRLPAPFFLDTSSHCWRYKCTGQLNSNECSILSPSPLAAKMFIPQIPNISLNISFFLTAGSFPLKSGN